MITAVVLLFLASSEYSDREAATRLARVLPRDSVSSAFRLTECPETKRRLGSVLREDTRKRVSLLLPDSRPFWPDRDYLRAHVPAEYREQIEGPPPGHKYGSYDGLTYSAYRLRSKAFVVWYVETTGDWCGAEDMLHQAAEDEAFQADKRSAYFLSPGRVFFLLWFFNPELLKGSPR